MDSLEEEVKKENTRYDWKQWIPVYGFYQNIKDYDEGKPCIMEHKALIHVYVLYNALMVTGAPFMTWYLLFNK